MFHGGGDVLSLCLFLFVHKITQKLSLDFHTIWGIGRLWTGESWFSFIEFIDIPVVDWCESESNVGKTSYSTVWEI